MSRDMVTLIMTRVGAALATILVVSLGVFILTQMLPGDTAEALLGQAATPQAVAGLRHAMHLDDPAWLRYLRWLGGLLTGNLGMSLADNLPVAQLIGERLPNSLLLAGVTTLVSLPLALTLGITTAMWRGSLYDRTVSMLTVAAVSVPEFLVASVAVLIFAVELHWLPSLASLRTIDSVGQFVRVFAMPVMSLSCVITAQMVRMTRAAVIDTLGASYIETALLKGAGPVRLVLVHALPNAIGPIANAVALSLSYLLGGVIVIETIFNYPGVAKLMVDGVATRDMPLVQSCAMLFSAAYLLLVTCADVLAILSNPRLKRR